MTCPEARSLLSLRLDHELTPEDEAQLIEHLRGCTSCQAARREMETEHDLLSRFWPAVVAPAGLSTRIVRSLPSRHAPKKSARWLQRPTPAIAVALTALFIAVTIAIPPVRASLGSLLESVSLRETSNPPAEQRLGEGPMLTFDEARQQVPWHIRIPGVLPDGYDLAGVLLDETERFADGPTVALYYLRGEAADLQQIRIVQRRMQPGAQADLPLERETYSYVRVGGRDALLIDGAWQQRDGSAEWVRGDFLQLIVEDGDLLITLEADPRDGWNTAGLIRVAESLR